jgi:hypothetical protein
MRELNRFRSDFNDCYSLRSKLKSTQKVSNDIGEFINTNAELLAEEKKTLVDFDMEKTKIKELSSNIEARIKQENKKED